MKTHASWIVYGTALLLAAVAGAQPRPSMRFEFYNAPEAINVERVAELARTLDMARWGAGEGLFVAPKISTSILPDPSWANREVVACTTIRFNGQPWGRCEWSWGGVELDIVVTPSSRAAHEYILAAMSENSLPTEMLIASYANVERLPDVGTVSFVTRSGPDVRIRFTRANVAVHIRSDRAGAEVIPLARRIDALIAKQQPLTPQQLLDRRPRVSISRPQNEGPAPFNVSAAPNSDVLQVHALVDGEIAGVRGGVVPVRRANRQVLVTVISTDLLAGSAELTLVR